MPQNIPDHTIRKMLQSARNIAVVGLSPKNERPSNRIGRYLIDHGYRIIPVNPGQDEILGLPCFSSLTDIPESIDIVNVFRRSEEAVSIVEQAISMRAHTVWFQQGIINHDAANLASENQLTCIMDRCIMVEHKRLII